MDWTKAKPDLIKEIQRQGEALLSSQQAFAINADQRALRLIGTLATLSIALLGVGITALSGAAPRPVLGIAGLCAGAFVVAGLVFALPAARPGTFNANGAPPSVWEKDLDAGAALESLLPEYCEHLQSRIAENEDTLQKNTRSMNYAMNLMAAAPVAGLVVAGLALVARAEGWLG
jgi:hypothetical protein